MSLVLLLLAWMLLCGIAGWCPRWRGRWTAHLARALILLGLVFSSFWTGVAHALQARQALPLAGPASAYVSVWVLVLLPILRRRLDAGGLLSIALSGLAAAAAFGLAFDALALIETALGVAETPLARASAWLARAVTFLALGLAGLVMRLLMGSNLAGRHWADWPWDYLAWYLGLLALALAG